MPSAPAIRPFCLGPSPTTAMKVMPMSARKNVSGEANSKTIGSSIGRIATRTRTPNRPPRPDDISAAPMASPPRPFRAMGKPSITVAALGGEPGMPRIIADTEPPV